MVLGQRGKPTNVVQFKRHDGDVFINPAHVAMVEPSSAGATHWQSEESRWTHRRLTTGTPMPTCRRRFCWKGESASTR